MHTLNIEQAREFVYHFDSAYALVKNMEVSKETPIIQWVMKLIGDKEANSIVNESGCRCVESTLSSSYINHLQGVTLILELILILHIITVDQKYEGKSSLDELLNLIKLATLTVAKDRNIRLDKEYKNTKKGDK